MAETPRQVAGTPRPPHRADPADQTDQADQSDLVRIAPRVQSLDRLGELLRRLRRRHARHHHTSQLTLRELAGRSGYAVGTIADYLNGRVLPPTDRFDVLIRLLGADRTELRALATARDRVEERRRAAPGGPPVPRELPPSVPGFTGRGAELAGLDRLRRRAGRGRGEVASAVIAGTAGVGKTALAIHWAHRVRASFPDGCLYLDLRGYGPDQPVPPGDALAGFLRSLGVPGAELPPTEAERSARYRSLLADRRTLVLLDDARDSAQVRPLLPGGSGCAALVTSRDPLTDLVTRQGARRIDLGPLPGADAVALLATLLGGGRVADQPDAAGTLADQCARLPLALRLVAQLGHARPEATLRELAAELADRRHRLDRLDAAGEPGSAVRAALSWSYQHLPAAAARAFRLCGLHPGHNLDGYAMAALAGTDLDHAGSLLQALVRASLLQPAGPGRFSLHDLLHAYAAELAGADPEPGRRAALARLRSQQLYACARAMELVALSDRDQLPVIVDPGLPVPQFAGQREATDWLDTERPTLVATAVLADEPTGPGTPATPPGRATPAEPTGPAAPAGNPHAGQLATILRRYLEVGAHHRDAEVLFQHAARTAPAPADRAHALTSLAVVCWQLGRYQEAADHQERALQLAREAGDRAVQGRALNGLGIVSMLLGRPNRTLEAWQQALELYRALGDRSGQARVLGNLGNLQHQLGNYPAALAHHRRALELFRAVGDPMGTANELGNLGSALQTVGQLPEALDHLREALTLAQQSGYRHCEVATANNLGVVYQRMGRLPEAREQHQHALALARTTADRRAEGYALGRLGTVYQHLGQLDEAVAHHHRALRVARTIGDDQLVAELRNRLGEALLAWPRPKQALRSYRRALRSTGRHGSQYEQVCAHHGIARALALIGGGPTARRHRERVDQLCTQLGIPPPEL